MGIKMEEKLDVLSAIMDMSDDAFNSFVDSMGEFTEDFTEADVRSLLRNIEERNSFVIKEDLIKMKNEIYDITKDIKEERKKAYIEKMFVPMIDKILEEVDKGCLVNKVKIHIEKVDENAKLPTYAHSGDACADIYSNEDTVIKPKERKIVKTGIKVAIPSGYEIQIRMRSGLAAKTDLLLANGIGTIDNGYKDEIGVILFNTGEEEFHIEKGDRIAQMQVAPIYQAEWIETNSVNDIGSNRNGGFGSTGK